MVAFVVYAFTLAIYVQATGTSTEVNNASIAFVDEDHSALSKEIINAFYPPRFQVPQAISADKVEGAMDNGLYMFVVTIPPRFESDLRAGRNPDIQLNIDATAMQQASIGANYVKSITNDRIENFLKRTDESTSPPIKLVVRKLFNPNADSSWYKSVVAIINQITLLTIVLTGAAVIREREHGTLEHLLVMPLTSFEIAVAKVWANGLVILIAWVASLFLVVQMALKVPCQLGSHVLWFHRRRALSVLRDGTRDLSGNDFAIDGSVCPLNHSGGRRIAATFRRIDTGREHAAMAAVSHVPAAVAAFCQLFASHHLPWRWTPGGLASISDGRRGWSGVLCVQPGSFPKVDRGDEVTIVPNVANCACPALLSPFPDAEPLG